MRRFLALLFGLVLAVALLGGCEVALRAGVGSPAIDRYTLYRLHGADGFAAIAQVRDPVRLLDEASALLQPDPALLWGLRPDLHLVADGLRLAPGAGWTVNTGPDGLRLPAAPAATVLALGDSCTFGWGVEDGEAWPAQLGARGRPTRNLGVPGYSILQGVALLRSLGVRPGPTLVLNFGANDGHKVARPDADWLGEARLLGQARRGLADLLLVRWGQHLLYPAYARATALAAPALGPRVEAAAYGAAIDGLLDEGFSLVLVGLCARDEYRAALRARARRAAFIDADALDIPRLDGCHPTVEGHARLAALVDAALKG